MSGLPPIGCLPIQMTAKSPYDRTCIEKENSNSQSYNKKLEELLPHLQAQLPGSKIFYADIYTPLSNFINYPHEYGKLSIILLEFFKNIIEYVSLSLKIIFSLENLIQIHYYFWKVRAT